MFGLTKDELGYTIKIIKGKNRRSSGSRS